MTERPSLRSRPPKIALWSLCVLCCIMAMPAGNARAAAGDLDSFFSGDGKVTTHFSLGGEWATGVAMQANNRIVVVGSSAEGKLVLVRYNVDGSRDLTFGGDGKVATAFRGVLAGASDVTIQPDGKIVVVGDRDFKAFAVVRYGKNGKLDPTFGGDGRVVTNVSSGGDAAEGVAVKPNGKIVVVGSANGRHRFGVVRYLPDGRLDRTFSEDGKAFVDIGRVEVAHDVAIDAGGRTLVVGWFSMRGGAQDFAVVRFDHGAPDAAFNGDGIATTDFGATPGSSFDRGLALAVQEDGAIVAAGFSSGGFALARYTQAGALDFGFGGDGKVTTSFRSGDPSDDFETGEAWDVAVQDDGKIVAVGTGTFDFAVARYLSDGSPDSGFGTNGTLLTGFGDFSDTARALTLQADGKIVAAGDQDDASAFAVARYLPG